MKQAHDGFVAAHGLLAKLAYALIVLHVGAALRHLVLLRDGVMGRMVPFLGAPTA
jgi:cytochrome b561